MTPASRWNVSGVISFVCGTVALLSGLATVYTTFYPGLLLMLVCVVLAFVFGLRGLRSPRNWLEELVDAGLKGCGMALATIAVVLGLLLPAGLGPSCPSGQTWARNNLKQIGLAFHAYHDEHGRLPPAVVRDAAGRPLYSWRVLLLPYLEEDKLYKEFRLDEPWDSPHNLALLSRMPKIYGSPEVQPPEPFHTFLQVITGPGTPFDGATEIKLPNDIPDDTTYTFLVVEAGAAVPWSKPVDLVYDPNGPIPELGGVFRGGTPWSGRNEFDGFHAVFLDGSVRSFTRKTVREDFIRAWITRDGGEEVPAY